VVYNGGSEVKIQDQRSGGGSWVTLGSWPFKAGADAYVEIGNNSPGTYVTADAVRFVGDTIVDNGSYRAAASTGTWYTAASLADKFGANYRYAVSSTSETATFRWTPLLPVTGYYKVYVWYSAHSSRATDAKYTIRGAGSPQTIQVDQTSNGGSWKLLGTQLFNAGATGHVELSNHANGSYVGADAVRFELQ
jgi:hyaluronate lyase